MATNLFSTESERQVIGSILLEPNKCLYCCSKIGLQWKDFTDPLCQQAYQAATVIQHVPKAFIDSVSVAAKMNVAVSVLSKFIDEVTTIAHVEYHAEVVKDFARRRQLVTMLESALETANSDTQKTTAEVLDAHQQDLMALNVHSNISINKIGDSKDAKLLQWRAGQNNKGIGIPTSFYELNGKLGGWRKTLGVIGAYRGVGKSTLCRQEALWQAQQGYKVALFTLEDPVDVAEVLIVGNHASQSVYYLDIGNGTESAFSKMALAWDELQGTPLYLIGNAYSMEQIISTAHMIKQKDGLDIIYIDHIQYIRPLILPHKNRTDTMAEYTSTLAILPKQLDCACVALSQFNRSPETQNREPKLSDLRDSGTLEQDARQILFLVEMSDESHSLKVAKNNFGPSGGSVQLYRNGGLQRFEPWDNQPSKKKKENMNDNTSGVNGDRGRVRTDGEIQERTGTQEVFGTDF